MNEITLKIEIPGLEELAKAVMMLAGKESNIQISDPNIAKPAAVPQQTPVQTPVAQVSQQTPVQTQTPPVIPQQIPVIPVMPLAAPPQTGQPGQPVQTQAPVPTTAVPITHTFDELAVAASQLVNMGKQQRLLEILSGFGVSALTELPPEKYSAFAGALKMEGVKF